jgi:hypothetical protein
MLGFNGQYCDPVTGLYLLGYRAYSTVLMRFISSDNLSPMGPVASMPMPIAQEIQSTRPTLPGIRLWQKTQGFARTQASVHSRSQP